MAKTVCTLAGDNFPSFNLNQPVVYTINQISILHVEKIKKKSRFTFLTEKKNRFFFVTEK